MSKEKIIINENEVNVHIVGKYLERDKNAIAIVGTRRMTPRGKAFANVYASTLAKKGITIVSGLARGIDTEAHNAALSAGGRTIAVLGHGVDIIYPPENYLLANKIMGHGCLITTYESGTKIKPGNFKERNGLIAGLSKAVLIIEGKRRSGTLSTAAHAARMGIEVFAIPGSEVTDWLIGEGASVANSPEDLLNFLNIT